MLVLGVSGSLRRDSYNRRLLLAGARELPAGAEFEEWRGLAAVPPYNADLDGEPGSEAADQMRAAFVRTDAILIATPEYNHSLPGQLKNALDWASRPFPDNVLRERPVAVVGASTGMFGAVWSQAEARKVLAAAGARVVDAELPVVAAHDAFAEDGSLRDPELRSGLRDLVATLCEVARRPLAKVA